MTRAFTLLELSIVLVIIGLIVGGVVAGQALIRNAEIQSVIKEIRGFETAVSGFRYKYDAWPGDIKNAHAYFDDGADGVCGDADDCNGNGDGFIEPTGPAIAKESVRAWQHLSLSGFLDGNYTGVNTSPVIPGVNYPESAIEGAYWSFTSNNSNNLRLQSVGGATGGENVLSAAEAKIIDRAVDDGLATTGKAYVTVGDCYSSSEYAVGDDTLQCFLFYSLN